MLISVRFTGTYRVGTARIMCYRSVVASLSVERVPPWRLVVLARPSRRSVHPLDRLLSPARQSATPLGADRLASLWPLTGILQKHCSSANETTPRVCQSSTDKL